MKTLITFSVSLCFIVICSCGQTSIADELRSQINSSEQQMYVIERHILNAGQLTQDELQAISQVSCNVLNELGEDITWLHSYVTKDKVFCVYKATNVDLIKQHAAKGGFPADAVVKVSTVIDPSTAN